MLAENKKPWTSLSLLPDCCRNSFWPDRAESPAIFFISAPEKCITSWSDMRNLKFPQAPSLIWCKLPIISGRTDSTPKLFLCVPQETEITRNQNVLWPADFFPVANSKFGWPGSLKCRTVFPLQPWNIPVHQVRCTGTLCVHHVREEHFWRAQEKSSLANILHNHFQGTASGKNTELTLPGEQQSCAMGNIVPVKKTSWAGNFRLPTRSPRKT